MRNNQNHKDSKPNQKSKTRPNKLQSNLKNSSKNQLMPSKELRGVSMIKFSCSQHSALMMNGISLS